MSQAEVSSNSLLVAATFAASVQQYAFYSPSPTNSPGRVARSTSSLATVSTGNPTRADALSSSYMDRSLKKPSEPPSTSQTIKKRAWTDASQDTSTALLKKRKRSAAGYQPPSTYSHLPNNLVDSLSQNLITLFIGVNPGLQTASSGHAYAHPSNLFWRLCHQSGCTPRQCLPSEDRDLPRLYALGHTNIVTRQSRDASELSAQEMEDGVSVLEEKCRMYRPESVCLVGKGVWEAVFRVWQGRPMGKKDWEGYGWMDKWGRMGRIAPRHKDETPRKRNGDIRQFYQKKDKKEIKKKDDLEPKEEGKEGEAEEAWEGARVFVATTTSGLAAGMSTQEKLEVWRKLGTWVEQRRKEKGIPDAGGVPDPVTSLITPAEEETKITSAEEEPQE